MLDRTNPGSAGSDHALGTPKPKREMHGRKSKRGGHSAHVLQNDNAAAPPDRDKPLDPAQFSSTIVCLNPKDEMSMKDGGETPHHPPFQDSHWKPEALRLSAVLGDDGAPSAHENQGKLSPIIAEIQQLWRLRQRWVRAQTALSLQGQALCRSFCGGEKEDAAKLWAIAAKGGDIDPFLRIALMPFLKAIENFAPERKAFEKRLASLAKSLPVWAWVESVKGFGAGNFGAIVGEAGDIGAYRNPSCLWKRMGMAVIDGGRQRGIADAEAALIHGYSPRRRAVAFVLGDTMIKAGAKCCYREVYDRRRARTAETHPDWTKGHSHNDAMRIMTKRALRDLWVQWRRYAAE